MYTLTLDPTLKTGTRIKPMHGVGQPPFLGMDYSMFRYLSEAGIPFSRLHDVGGPFGGSRYVDIPNLFPDFNADPTDPANYDFTFTDTLICALMEHRCEPFFRLGVTIENYSELRSYRIAPPKDNLQWARICEGIIAHYTEGWAEGYRFDIRYWEIWNEPENQPEPHKNHMWAGTAEEYYRLYADAAIYLKNRFPHLKFGGYGSCGFYAIQKEKSARGTNPAASHRHDYFVTFFEGFLAYLQERNAPLDFFSWHNYDNVENGQIYAQYVRDRLDEAGFTHTETTCNEWNYQYRLRGTAKHAALVAAQMVAFENSPLDSAMFYDARLGVSEFGALFNPMTRQPTKEYHGFLAYNRLYELQEKLTLPADLPQGVHAAAAIGENCLALMLVNHADTPAELAVECPAVLTRCRITDETHDWEETS